MLHIDHALWPPSLQFVSFWYLEEWSQQKIVELNVCLFTGEAATIIQWEPLLVTWGRSVHGAAGQDGGVSLEFSKII